MNSKHYEKLKSALKLIRFLTVFNYKLYKNVNIANFAYYRKIRIGESVRVTEEKFTGETNRDINTFEFFHERKFGPRFVVVCFQDDKYFPTKLDSDLRWICSQ